jgi:DHA2 family multidrug resistance protein-like MFS transporter
MSQVDGLPLGRRRWLMLCILLGMVLSALDSAIANIALPVIARSLASSDSAVVLVVNCYQLTVTVCLLLIASLSESLGLKRVYATGLAIFTLASLLCAMSPTLTMLVSARIFQGVGGACMAVAGMALVRTIYPRSIVSRGFAMVALVVAISGALGPTIAAAILTVASWHWLFLVNVPFGILAIPVFLALAPSNTFQARTFDLAGAVLNALALGSIISGVGRLGMGNMSGAVEEIAVGLGCLGILIWQQMRKVRPLLPLDLMRLPMFALSVGTSSCSYAAQILAYVSLPFFFEKGLRLTPVETGLLLTPWPLLVAVSAPIAGRLAGRYPASVVSSVGLTVLAAGLVLLASLPVVPGKLNIVWRLALCGIGFGLFQTPNNTVMMTSGPVERSGAASGMNAVARNLGWSLGSAVVALVFGFAGTNSTTLCLWAGAGFAAIGAIFSSARWHR